VPLIGADRTLPMPALLTRMSMRPAASSAVAVIRSNDAGSLKSDCTAFNCPARRLAATVPLSSSSHGASRSTATTSMPAPSRPRVMARPMPLAAPVTIAVFRWAVMQVLSSRLFGVALPDDRRRIAVGLVFLKRLPDWWAESGEHWIRVGAARR
jgi:hypothetical protein